MDWEHTVGRITQVDVPITVAIASWIVFGLKVWGIMTIYIINCLTCRVFRVFAYQ